MPSGTASGQSGTDLRVPTASKPGQLILRLHRILLPDILLPDTLLPDGTGIGEESRQPCVSVTWRHPDGTRPRGVFVSAVMAPGEA